MKILISLFVIIMLVSGCAMFNPYYKQYQELDQAYKEGKLTAPEYFKLKQNLQAQELQWRANYMGGMASSPRPTYQDNTQQVLMQQQQQLQQQTRDYYNNLPKIPTQTNCQTYCNNYGNCQTTCN